MRTIILFAFVLALTGCNKPPYDDVRRSEYGTVVSVESCRAGKRILRCMVKTDIATYHDLKVDDFPEEIVQVGDRLGYEKRYYGRRYDVFLCKNDMCSMNASCLWGCEAKQ